MEYFVTILAVWPAAGLVVLTIVSRRRGGVLPPGSNGAEVLARMYLWPLVWWRLGRGPHLP